MRVVTVKAIETLERLGTARGNEVRVVPPSADGGGDGFLSGELLMIALGSCVLGSARPAFEKAGIDAHQVEVTVKQVPAKDGQPGRLVVLLSVDRPADEEMARALRAKALSGGVGSRLVRCGEVSLFFADEAETAAA